jgi:protein gp37
MGSVSTIEWTDATWNPVRGCSRTSPGCQRCYAERVAGRFSGVGQPYEGFATRAGGHGKWTGKLALVPEHLADPLRWKKPRRIFVNSMSDLFHEELLDEDVAAVFGIMAAASHHTFQILTKRAERMRDWFEWVNRGAEISGIFYGTPQEVIAASAAWATTEDEMFDERINSPITGPWPLPNVLLGVSVETQQFADERIPRLLRTPATTRFVSYEPALGPVNFESTLLHPNAVWKGNVLRSHASPADDVPGLDWVIVGAESGYGARPFDEAWARQTRDACARAGVAFFYKQRVEDKGRRKVSLPLLDGVRHDAWPPDWGGGDRA